MIFLHWLPKKMANELSAYYTIYKRSVLIQFHGLELLLSFSIHTHAHIERWMWHIKWIAFRIMIFGDCEHNQRRITPHHPLYAFIPSLSEYRHFYEWMCECYSNWTENMFALKLESIIATVWNMDRQLFRCVYTVRHSLTFTKIAEWI